MRVPSRHPRTPVVAAPTKREARLARRDARRARERADLLRELTVEIERIVEHSTGDDLDALHVEELRAVLSASGSAEHAELDDVLAPRGDSLPTNRLDPETVTHFITSRRSIRDFAPTTVDRDLVTQAVQVAMSAPSVCNRQGWRTYWFDTPEDLARVLPLHSGSSGFGDKIPGAFVITYDVRAYEGPHERNQGWIDSGLFSQNLLLALHGLGLGAVPLNWSRNNHTSGLMREAAAIPDHENIVMLIGVGHPAEGYRVARSARRPLQQVLRVGMPQRL